jgi:hypothetical protein
VSRSASADPAERTAMLIPEGTTMRAAVVTEFGAPLQVVERDRPRPSAEHATSSDTVEAVRR